MLDEDALYQLPCGSEMITFVLPEDNALIICLRKAGVVVIRPPPMMLARHEPVAATCAASFRFVVWPLLARAVAENTERCDVQIAHVHAAVALSRTDDSMRRRLSDLEATTQLFTHADADVVDCLPRLS